MNTTTELDMARDAIIQGETARAVALLLKSVQGNKNKPINKIYKELCIQSNKLNQLKKNRRSGVISHENYMVEFSQVNSVLLETIIDIEEDFEAAGIEITAYNTDDTFSLPRISVPTKLYWVYLSFCFLGGVAYSIACMITLHNYILREDSQLAELLFVVAQGVFAQMFLVSAIDGINLRKSKIIDWRIIGPHVVIGTMLCVIAGILKLL